MVAHLVAHLISYKAKLHQSLCSYYHTASKSYRYLASQDIIQGLYAVALHHLHFCVNPPSVEYCSQCTSSAMVLFLSWGQCSAHQLCWLLVFRQNAPLLACPVPPCHVRTVQTHVCWRQSPAFSRNRHHAPTQHIPICGPMGCQDQFYTPGLA